MSTLSLDVERAYSVLSRQTSQKYLTNSQQCTASSCDNRIHHSGQTDYVLKIL